VPGNSRAEEDQMADLVMGYCASRPPMTAAARESAPAEQSERFFAAVRRARDEAVTCDVQAAAVIASGGLPHFVGEPRVGDVDEEFDRWSLRRLQTQDYDELFALPDDELTEASNGTGEVRAWMAVAGAMRGAKAEVLAYEPIDPWIDGMGVVLFDRARD
jgi:hypothetical protein